jgi:hypothetical protein
MSPSGLVNSVMLMTHDERCFADEAKDVEIQMRDPLLLQLNSNNFEEHIVLVY